MINNSKTKVFTQETKEEIYNLCNDRWDFYKKEDGGYYPSKHDKKVITDVAEHYGIRYEDADEIFMEVSKVKADQLVKGMNKKQMVDLFDKIVKGNTETPWGQMEKQKNNK